MTNARFLRYATLEELRSQVPANLAAYRTGDFKYVEVDGSYWFEHDAPINDAKLAELLPPTGQDLHEPENCKIVYEALKDISPYEARDERLWVYLTHTLILDYTRARWPIPEDDEAAVSHIRKHFFARDKRQVERDNSASRLWWMAHLCARVPAVSLVDSLEAILFRSDVRANIIERPTSSQSSELFSAIVGLLYRSLKGEKQLFERAVFRQFMREINSVGGFKLLDCMSSKQIDNTLNKIINERLQLPAL